MNKIDSSFQAYLQSELPDLQQDQTFERLKFNGENKAGLLFSEMPFQNDPDSKSQQWNNYIEALTQVATPKEDELISLFDAARLVFEVDPSLFNEHFSTIDSPTLQSLGASIYKHKDFPNHCIFFPSEDMLVQDSNAIIYPNRDSIDSTEHLESSSQYYILSLNHHIAQFVRIFSSREVIHFACSKEGLLIHHSDLPSIPQISNQQYHSVQEHRLYQSLMQYAFQVRYHSFQVPSSELSSKEAFLSQVMQPSKVEDCPAIYMNVLNKLFEETYLTLEKSIPSNNVIDESTIVHWLMQRDELESLYYLVGQNSPDHQQQLIDLDQKFPTYAFAHILPDSEQLANAWFTDPSNWWGQSAAMGQLLSQQS